MSDNQGTYILALIPKPPLGNGEVRITELPFLIGRQVDQFRKLGRANEDAKHAISKISRHHAEIFLGGGVLKAKDLGSLNGTYVNKKRLHENDVARIADGDHISFSEYADFIIQIQRSSISPSPLSDAGEVDYDADAVEKVPDGSSAADQDSSGEEKPMLGDALGDAGDSEDELESTSAAIKLPESAIGPAPAEETLPNAPSPERPEPPPSGTRSNLRWILMAVVGLLAVIGLLAVVRAIYQVLIQ